MTIWRPRIEDAAAPRYLAIANAIANDMESGVLTPGSRLPTHRDLADFLGVTVGTVTRGYAEAERRGLTVGEVGRGTFVRGREVEAHGWASGPPSETSRVIDMSLATPWTAPGEGELLAETLRQITRETDMVELLQYQHDSATLRHRAAAASWIARTGLEAPPERVIVTAGGQHAMTALLSALLRPGDTILAGELTYPGMKALAQMLGLRIRGVALDEEGIRPDALEEACHDGVPAALYAVPTLQNPTCATMSEERRRQIAHIAQRHDLLVLEDHVHAHMVDDEPPPLTVFAPERTIHLSTISKSVTFGLRTGFVVAPDELVERVRAGVRSTIWMPPPLMTEVTTRWLSDGTADRVAAMKRAELKARMDIAREVLGDRYDMRSSDASIHFWLQLPEPWRSDECVAQARQRGVLVAGAEAFAVGRRDVPHAVRVCVGSIPQREDVKRGLEILSEVLEGCADPCVDIL
jgi:DNA-binding transcriptional MocR family regulator